MDNSKDFIQKLLSEVTNIFFRVGQEMGPFYGMLNKDLIDSHMKLVERNVFRRSLIESVYEITYDDVKKHMHLDDDIVVKKCLETDFDKNLAEVIAEIAEEKLQDVSYISRVNTRLTSIKFGI